MDIELKERWVDALRSGEIEQGEGTFLLDGKFCALGVLLDLTGVPREKFELHSLDEMFDDEKLKPAYDEVERLLGASTVSELWELNDGGATFPELADWIERNV